jgi:hypothetical protein
VPVSGSKLRPMAAVPSGVCCHPLVDCCTSAVHVREAASNPPRPGRRPLMAAAKSPVRSTNRLRLIFFSALAAVVGGAALTGHNDPATAGGAANLVPTFAAPVPRSGLMPSTLYDPTAAFPLPSFAAVPLPTVVLPPPKPAFPLPSFAAVPLPTVVLPPPKPAFPLPSFAAVPLPTVVLPPPKPAFPLPSFAAVPLPTVVLPPPKPVFPVPTVAAVPVLASPTGSATTCGADFYRNVDGNCVQRPTAVAVPPVGATAQCADGTHSFSQHRQGTCSHHGGVATGP